MVCFWCFTQGLVWMCQGRTQDFALGLRPKGGRGRAGVGFLGREQQPPPHQRGALGALWAPPAGFWAESRPPKGFHYIFSTQDGLSCHYNIVNNKKWTIVWPLGTKTPVPSPLCTHLECVWVTLCFPVCYRSVLSWLLWFGCWYWSSWLAGKARFRNINKQINTKQVKVSEMTASHCGSWTSVEETPEEIKWPVTCWFGRY